MREKTLAAAIAAAALIAAAPLTAGAARKDARPSAGFDTARAPQLVPLADGVRIDPLFSTGDVFRGYQMSGIPDGLGAYRARDGRPVRDRTDSGRHSTLEVLMNHELDGTEPPGVGARVSHLSLDPKTMRTQTARYALDGTEGFSRFCSATLEWLGGRPLYLTGEEATEEEDGVGRGGSSIVLDPRAGTFRETRHFGLFAHENVVPLPGLGQAAILSPEDGDPGENESQLYAYIAPTFEQAIAGTGGSLHVWRADPGQGQDGNPSSNDIGEGETLSGRFVPVSQAENADAATLEASAQAREAFDFVRLEDLAIGRTGRSTLWVTDTGRIGTESVRGRLYRLRVDPSDPTRLSITLALDADAQAGRPDPVKLVNPDNIDTSERSVVIQEDRNSEHRGPEVEGGYGRVLLYDIATGGLRAVARVATPSGLRPGEWESSGVINAFDLLGAGRWLIDVQAHETEAPQPGPGLAPGSSVGEDGQLLELRIGGT